MHQTRATVSKKLPIHRKGTKYVARASIDLQNSVPVVVAIRDILKLASTAKEVKEMIKQKLLKINGKNVKDLKDSIKLLDIFEADRTYVLTLTTNGKFAFEETGTKERICKVIGKKLVRGGKIQINLHEGSNILSDEKIGINDTIYLNLAGKIVKHTPIQKSKECIIISGKYIGKKGLIKNVEEKKVEVHIQDKGKLVNLEKKEVMVL